MADWDLDGWLCKARQVKSPNFNSRPLDIEIDLLVIHHISLPKGLFGTNCVDLLFTNQLHADSQFSWDEQHLNLRVSSHFFINRLGQITQYVSVLNRAWHAGTSEWLGRSNCNDFSIGIELEGTGEVAYEHAQYEALTDLTHLLLEKFPGITQDRIVGHSDIAPGRKTDPGPSFDWHRYRGSLN